MSEQQSNTIWTRLFLYLMLIDLIAITLAISGRILLDWQPLMVFHVFFYGAQLGLVLAIIGVLQLLFGFFKKRKSHLTSGALTLVLALVPIVVSLFVVGISAFKAPMIHDISTDLKDPPVFSITNSLRTAEENSLEYAGESIAALQREAFPDIQTLVSSLSPQASHAKALQALDALDWVLIVDDASTGTIEAFDKSGIFGFIDDIAIRIIPMEGGSQIDVRSVSRVGLGDLGANAQRIRRFFRVFEA
jgi:uncharacterized protein (DUF1499 family)